MAGTDIAPLSGTLAARSASVRQGRHADAREPLPGERLRRRRELLHRSAAGDDAVLQRRLVRGRRRCLPERRLVRRPRRPRAGVRPLCRADRSPPRWNDEHHHGLGCGEHRCLQRERRERLRERALAHVASDRLRTCRPSARRASGASPRRPTGRRPRSSLVDTGDVDDTPLSHPPRCRWQGSTSSGCAPSSRRVCRAGPEPGVSRGRGGRRTCGGRAGRR